MSYTPKGPAFGNTARPAVAKGQPAAQSQGGKANNLHKLTGMFPTDKENLFEVRITPEVLEALHSVKEGSYLKAFINFSEKTNKQYITLAVKEVVSKS